MSEPLQDPNLPAGAIISTSSEGFSTRNDGKRVKLATSNPWYVLATVYGEQATKQIDEELHARNRRIWNGWACAQMEPEERRKLSKKLDVRVDELAPLSGQSLADLKAAFAERCMGAEIPEPTAKIDLSVLHFPRTTVWAKCVFNGDVDFRYSTFRNGIDFSSAKFCRDALFRSSTFSGFADFEFSMFSSDANFQSCTFSESALFLSSTFSQTADFRYSTFSMSASFASSTFRGYTDFESCKFGWIADFMSSTFDGTADFRSITCGGDADFRSCVFSGFTYFSDGAFKSSTMFKDARFLTEAPKFFQREFHQNTTFTTKQSHWPAITADNAEDTKNAYQRLAQVMRELNKPDDEHFFFRQEMRCKAVLEGFPDNVVIKLYGLLSDYGYSVLRPAAWLAGIVAVGWGLIGSWLRHGTPPADQAILSPSPIAEGLGISIGNTLPFLGFVRKMHPDFYKEAPAWLDAFSGFQSLMGIVLLFFMGLGLRNRFRLK